MKSTTRMQTNKPADNRMVAAAERMILGVLCVSLISLCLVLIRSGLSLTI